MEVIIMPETLTVEQLFVPREEVFPTKVEEKKPTMQKKRYIVYLSYPVDENTGATSQFTIKLSPEMCTREEIISQIMDTIVEGYVELTDFEDVTAENLYDIFTTSEIYCMNEAGTFARAELLDFFMTFKDTVLSDEYLNDTFHEYLNLVIEIASIDEDDYDASKCRDVLKEE